MHRLAELDCCLLTLQKFIMVAYTFTADFVLVPGVQHCGAHDCHAHDCDSSCNLSVHFDATNRAV